MTRTETTELIILQKLRKQLKWQQLAEATGQSAKWTTAALLRKMTLNAAKAVIAACRAVLPAR